MLELKSKLESIWVCHWHNKINSPEKVAKLQMIKFLLSFFFWGEGGGVGGGDG